MRSAFVRLLVVTLLLQTAVYAIRPMVSYRALDLGADNAQLGLIAAAFASLSLLVAVPIGRWVDRWGEPGFVLLGAATISAVSVWLVFVDDLVTLALSQAVLGFGHIASVVGSQTLVANQGDPEGRTARFGAFTVAVSLGQLAGPALGGLLAGGATGMPAEGGRGVDGTTVFAATAMATAAAVVVAAFIWYSQRGNRPTAQRAAPGSPTDRPWRAAAAVLRIPSVPYAMVASLTVLTTIDLIAVYLPAYGEQHGISVQVVGLLLAARGAASMASRVFMLPMLRRWGRKRVLVASIATPAVGLALLPLFTGPVPLLVLMVLAGFGLGLGQPVTLSWVADRAPKQVRGTALGVRLTGNRLGQVVLPVLVGGVAGGTGVAFAFISMSVLLAGSVTAVLRADFATTDPPDS